MPEVRVDVVEIAAVASDPDYWDLIDQDPEK